MVTAQEHQEERASDDRGDRADGKLATAQQGARRRVAQEQEREVEFFGKVGVFFNRVKTDAQNFNIL